MPRRPITFSLAATFFSALAFAFALPACTASMPATPPSAANVIEWAVGPEHLDTSPASSGNMMVLLDANAADGANAANGAAPPPPLKCPLVTTILPDPSSETRVYGLIAGKLQAFETLNAVPAPLLGANPSLLLTRLLAFARTAQPLTLLVSARPAGAQGEQIWALTLKDHAITAAVEVTDKQAFASQEAFFRQYDAPRCKPGGKNCVALSSDGKSSFLDVAAVRGAPPKTLQKLTGIAIDASWATADGNRIYLLVPCPPKGPS